MKIRIIYIVTVFFCIQNVFTFPKHSEWSAVAAGEPVADPVQYRNRIYFLTSDRALNCLDIAGSFIWRRPIKRAVKPQLIRTQNGSFIVWDQRGLIQAFSGQGLPLWVKQMQEPLLYPPFSAQDGRLYISGKKTLTAISAKGAVKWHLPLSADLAVQICEMGGHFLLIQLKNKEQLTISHFGTVLHRQKSNIPVTAIAVVGSGSVIGTADGTIAYYTSSVSDNRIEPVWTIHDPLPPVFMQHAQGRVLCGYANGMLSLKDIRTGAARWTVQLGTTLESSSRCIKVGREYLLSRNGFAAVITDTGQLKWETAVPVKKFFPLVTQKGSIILIENWVINSYRMETRLVSTAAIHEKGSDVIQAFTGAAAVLPEAEPFFIPNNDIKLFLNRLEKAVQTGSGGQNERKIAYRLQVILTNTARSKYYPYSFSVHDRAHAAVLLGQFESLAYRPALLNEAAGTRDTVLAAGIIKALGMIAVDPDGKSVMAIRQLLKGCSSKESEPVRAACDALIEIAKYNGDEQADECVQLVFSIATGVFSDNIKQYARQKLKSIVE